MRTTPRSLASSLVVTVLSLAAGCEPLGSFSDAAPETFDSDASGFDAALPDAALPDAALPDAAPSSDARSDAPTAAPLAFGTVLHEPTPWIVLAARYDGEANGPLRAMEAGEGHAAVTRELTERERASLARPALVRVYRGAQWLCDASVGAPVALAVGERGFDEQGEPGSREPQDLWDYGLRVVAAPLTAVRGRCEGAGWARDAALVEPRFAHAERADAALERAAIEALASSRQGVELQQRHEADCARDEQCTPSWTARGDVLTSAVVYRTSDGGRWVYATATDQEHCGGFGVNLSILARVREERGRVSLGARSVFEGLYVDPDALVEGDDPSALTGAELRFGGGRATFGADAPPTIESADVPVYGCGC